MRNELQFDLGGVTVAFTGQLPPLLPEDPAFLFLSEGKEPDISVQLSVDPGLRLPEGLERIWQTPLRIYGRAGEQAYLCFGERLHREPACTAVLELGEPLSLTLRDLQGSSYGKLMTFLAPESLLLRRERLPLHASWIDRGGRALVFTAPSGVGKSTQAELWRRFRGAEVINGDKTLLDLSGAPRACGFPFAGTSGICKNSVCPLEAVVVLAQGPENVIRPLTPMEAVKALLSQVPMQPWNRQDLESAMDLCVRLAKTVPIYHLSCVPDESAVRCLENALEG